MKKNQISATQQEMLRQYLQGSAALKGSSGVCNFDMTCGNALICNSDYNRICLIDLEWANIAPVPDYQLACIAAGYGPESEITAAFFEGYGVSFRKAVENSPDLERLTLHRLMRATAWARDRAPALLEENLRRTRPVLERYFAVIAKV